MKVYFDNPRRSKLPGKAPWLVLTGPDGKRVRMAAPVDLAGVPWGLRLTQDIAFTNLTPVTLPTATSNWGLVDGFYLAARRNGRPCWRVRLAAPVNVLTGYTLCFLPGQLFAEGAFIGRHYA